MSGLLIFLIVSFIIGLAITSIYRMIRRWLFPRKPQFKETPLTHETGTDFLGREVHYMKFGEDEEQDFEEVRIKDSLKQ
jgi:hypothetical protein